MYAHVAAQVQLMAGKDKGEQGKVVAVIRKKQEVLVEGLNCVRTQAVSSSTQGIDGIYAISAHYPEVMFICPTWKRICSQD